MKRVQEGFIAFLLAATAIQLSCKKNNLERKSNLSIIGFSPLMAGSGETVTVYGSGFSSVIEKNNIAINGVGAEVVEATSNRMIFIVPSVARSGRINLSIGSFKASSEIPLNVITVISGGTKIIPQLTLIADRKYLLRGDVLVNDLKIAPGTVIFGEKKSRASLSFLKGSLQGTAVSPIIFTSDQPAGSRNPGDWKGVTVIGKLNSQNQSSGSAFGEMRFVRVEYAGYVPLGQSARLSGALAFRNRSFQNLIEDIQISYSGGNSFFFDVRGDDQVPNEGSAGATLQNARFLVSYAAAGVDFFVNGVNLQFILGMKDPYIGLTTDFTDGLKFLTDRDITGTAPKLRAGISNMTLIGRNPAARGIDNPSIFQVLKSSGERLISTSDGLDENNYVIYNSVLAAGFRCGVSLDLQGFIPDRSKYNASGFVNNYIVGQLDPIYATLDRDPDNMSRGGLFAYEHLVADISGYQNISSTEDYKNLVKRNFVTSNLDLLSVPSLDDLGLSQIANYSNYHKPNFGLMTASQLLNGAIFPKGTLISDPAFNKNIRFVGAFGSEDWTKGWCDFNAQQTVH